MVEPLVLKEFKNRWYILVDDSTDAIIKTFALDRITNLEIAKKKIQFPTDFNISEYYRNCFGIMGTNEKKPKKLFSRLTQIQGKCIKSLPCMSHKRLLQTPMMN